MKNLDKMKYTKKLNMSNCFHTIDDGLEKLLKNNAGKIYAQYAGWNFCGYVWFEKKHFICQVWVYGDPQEEITATTLEEIMEKVSDKYGSE